MSKKIYAVIQDCMTWYQLDGRHVARLHHRWAHVPVIYAASHFYHEKRISWVSISMHACDPVSIVMGLRLAALQAARVPLQRNNFEESQHYD